jgi:hypothetical protein
MTLKYLLHFLGLVWLSQAVFGQTFQDRHPGIQILEQVKAHKRGLAVWWVGNAGWLIKSDDELKLRLSNTLQERYHKLQQGEMFVIK